MIEKQYKAWDWEHDAGKGEIPTGASMPRSHAIALYDDRGFIYRVIVNNPEDMVALDCEQEGETYIYDYFCDQHGEIREKRSLDDNGDVVLIVRYEYDNGRKCAEVGWNPKSDTGPTRVELSE